MHRALISVHTDVVGSLLRPSELVAARERLAASTISPAAFKAVEDRAVDAAVRLQEESGLDVVTDGEMRRLSFRSALVNAVDGFGEVTLDAFLWDGRWAAVVSVEDGRRKFMYARTARKEAAQKLADALRVQSQGVPLPDDRVTLKQFLEQWLEHSFKPSVRPWTYRGYEVHVRIHIVPALGHVRLTKLTPHQNQSWINAKTGAGLAPKTIHYMKGTLQVALNQAMKGGMVMRNVAALVESPRKAPVKEVAP